MTSSISVKAASALRQPETVVRCRIAGDRASTTALVDEIVACATDLDYPESDRLAIHAALEEALQNAIRHGNGGCLEKAIDVEYRASPRRVWVCLRDEGPGFDPDSLPDPTAAENLTRPGGRGVLMMRHFMDQVAFLPPGNCVCLVRFNRKAPT